ncbi:MAG: M16 family metallopeptidase [Candidatus Thermochlorobacter sp.]
MRPIEFSEFTLPNGLHCIVHENHTTPIVAVDLWYHVGSKNERPDRTGFAHLFEHLMFQGSRHVGKTEHFAYIQRAGGTLNGTTNEDRTNFFETLPANQLELALWLESDRMMSLDLSAENFENQRQVVKEERRMRYDNAPYGTVYERLHERAYFQHPYRWTTIGSMAHLDAATLEEAQEFFNTYYVPNNATLVLAGDVTAEEAEALVTRYFGDIPRGKDIVRPSDFDLPLTQEVRDTIYDNVQLAGLFIAYRICDVKHPDADVLGVISRMLSDGRSSRLYRNLVHTKQLAQSVSALAAPAEHPGLFFINAIAAQGASLSELEREIDAELQRLVNGDLSEEELQKAKNGYEMGLLKSFSMVRSLADNLAYFHTFFGSAAEINRELERATGITLEDVQRVAKRYFSNVGRVVLHWLPKHNQ